MRIKHNIYSDIKDRPVTVQRRLLLDILKDAKGHLDAKELYRHAIERDRNISLATVYRNLRLFKELDLVDEIRLDDIHCYYELKHSTEHYHLICAACGEVSEFESPLIGKLASEVESKCGFEVSRAVLHLEGNCQKCKDKMEKGRI